LYDKIIFFAIGVIGLLIFWNFLSSGEKKEKIENKSAPIQEDLSEAEEKNNVPKTSIIKKIFAPKFKVKEIPSFAAEESRVEIKQPVGANEIPKAKGKPFSYTNRSP